MAEWPMTLWLELLFYGFGLLCLWAVAVAAIAFCAWALGWLERTVVILSAAKNLKLKGLLGLHS